MYRIAVIGTGYVGLVTGACLADFGLNVTCADVDELKIEKLKRGKIPIYEPGLATIVKKNMQQGRLNFTSNKPRCIEDSDIVFIAVGTPSSENGSADLQYVEAVAEEIGMHMNGYKVVVSKSTVPIGTGRQVKRLIRKHTDKPFDVVSNPEFLREGAAVKDFMHPDRIVIGAESDIAAQIIKDVYRVLYLNEVPFVITNIETAELIKYASNAFLAMKISFINEMANLCEKVGANVTDLAIGVGKDGRIGPKFLHPGPGFGGSCFPKDILALTKTAEEYGSPVTLVETAMRVNESQKSKMIDRIKAKLGDVRGRTIAVLGLAFKPETDDIREAPALTIISKLDELGAHIKAYDPKAMEEARRQLAHVKNIEFCRSEHDAIMDADALVIVTEWNQFRNLDLTRIKSCMKEPCCFFDFRNIYKPDIMKELGFDYDSIGRIMRDAS
jgi:UDPglucose 6-dehydrogenase